MLTDAALDVMAADEWRSATVEQIGAAAGLNKRYFYEGFAEIDALASAVVDDIAEEVREATLAAFGAVPDEPLERQSLASVDTLARVLARDPRGPGCSSAGSPPPRACACIARRCSPG